MQLIAVVKCGPVHRASFFVDPKDGRDTCTNVHILDDNLTVAGTQGQHAYLERTAGIAAKRAMFWPTKELVAACKKEPAAYIALFDMGDQVAEWRVAHGSDHMEAIKNALNIGTTCKAMGRTTWVDNTDKPNAFNRILPPKGAQPSGVKMPMSLKLIGNFAKATPNAVRFVTYEGRSEIYVVFPDPTQLGILMPIRDDVVPNTPEETWLA